MSLSSKPQLSSRWGEASTSTRINSILPHNTLLYSALILEGSTLAFGNNSYTHS
jgi:hypothetical protein